MILYFKAHSTSITAAVSQSYNYSFIRISSFSKFQNTEAKLERCVFHGDMFLILYSITDRSSFEEADRIASFVKDRKQADTALVILVGTKRDLEHFREVDESEGSELAHQIDCPFYEISISECDGYKEVTEMLHGCIKAFLQRDKSIVEKQRSSLMKMKEGLIRKTGSLRRKSVSL